MAAKELPGDTVVRIKIPSLKRDKKPIPTDKRELIILAIEKSFTNENGGATRIDAIGTWSSKEQGAVQEEIAIIESHGNNPFSVADIEFISEHLDQEVIMTETASGVKAHLIGKDTIDMRSPTIVYYSDGSKLIYSEVKNPDSPEGEPVLWVKHYDSSGNKVEETYLPIDANDNKILEHAYTPYPEEVFEEFFEDDYRDDY